MAAARGFQPTMRRATICAVLVVAALFAAAAPAAASELTLGTRCDKYMSCERTATYTAAPGEKNDVRFATNGTAFVVTDAGAAIRFPAGICTGDGGHVVTCDLVPLAPIAPLTVTLGDGDDRADTSAAPLAPALLDGGPGNDVLVAGSLYDRLAGGPGNDVLDGGPGTDIASYADHPAGVRVDLATGRASGPPAERDALANIENLLGGPGSDVLTGDAGANTLTGGGGKDVIDGAGGADDVAGVGALDGGDGDDRVRLKGPGSAVCGAGTKDQATASGRASVVDDSCESVRLPGVTVALKLGHRDPSKDRFQISLLGLLRGETLVGRLATIRGRPLGSLRRPITNDLGRGGHTTLRFSSTEVASLRRSRATDVILTVKRADDRSTRRFGGNVRVRLHRG